MSLARLHRDRILAEQAHAVTPDDGEAHAPATVPLAAAGATSSSPADRAAAQIAVRMTHDLRRLKEIRSIDNKIAAKRTLLPEYEPWVEGVLAADNGVGAGLSADVVPTCMVWLIDVGCYDPALQILEFLLRHNVQMPSRYQRDAPTIAVEEIADAALKAQAADKDFSLSVLERVAELTAGLDLHDEVTAKLDKAIGAEMLREAEAGEAIEATRAVIAGALAALERAQTRNPRVGVKDRIKRAKKLLAVQDDAFPPAPDTNEQGGPGAA